MESRGIYIKYIRVKEVLYKLTNGCTDPVRSILENDILAIVKLYNNPQGNLTLVNEYICYRLSNLLELPMPESGICIADANTISNNDALVIENYGPCFYSKYLEKSVTLKNSIIPLLSNREDFYKLILFDHIVYNKDRNIFNLLVQFYKSNISFTLIDHSHVFKNETIWDAQCFKQGMNELDFNDNIIIKSNDDIYSMFYHTMNISLEQLKQTSLLFKEKISYDIINNIIKEIPNEWGLNSSNGLALINYILYRLEHIDDICLLIYKSIKNI